MSNSTFGRNGWGIQRASVYLGLFALGVALLTGSQKPPSAGDKKHSQGYEVDGYVLVKVRVIERVAKPPSGGQAQILLPDFEVFLKNVKTGEESKPVKSNL